MSYKLITLNDDCPQTHLNVSAVQRYFKSKGIKIEGKSDRAVIISCILFDVDRSSALDYAYTVFGNNILVYGCVDSKLKKDWQGRISFLDGGIPEVISGRMNYHFAEDSVIVKINTGCDGKCAFCRLRGRGNESFNKIDILNEIGKYPEGSNIVLFSNDCSSYFYDLIELVEDMWKRFPNITIMVHSCSVGYFVENQEWFGRAFKNKGILGLGLSLQSGSEKILNFMNRDSDLFEVKDALRNIFIPKGSHLYSEFIFGFPGEEEEDVDLSLEMAKLFTHVVWYRYYKVKNTVSAQMFPDIWSGKDYSKRIMDFAIDIGIPVTVVDANKSMINMCDYFKYRWVIKK